jgi:predicted permease
VTTSADIETADRLSRRRARMLFALAIIFLAQQVSYLSGPDTGMRTVDHVKIAAWLVMSIVLLLLLTTGGFWFYSRKVRELMEDDVTRANRGDAIRFGFMAMMTAGIILYFVSLYEPMSGRQAIHLLTSVGIGVALFRFGFLERRAHKDG